jgi:enoyl-[acyl-carrier-protein] reductase (NADH)
MTREQLAGTIASKTHTRRLPLLAEMGNVAAFTASDKARAITGTIANLTPGNLDD